MPTVLDKVAHLVLSSNGVVADVKSSNCTATSRPVVRSWQKGCALGAEQQRRGRRKHVGERCQVAVKHRAGELRQSVRAAAGHAHRLDVHQVHRGPPGPVMLERVCLRSGLVNSERCCKCQRQQSARAACPAGGHAGRPPCTACGLSQRTRGAVLHRPCTLQVSQRRLLEASKTVLLHGVCEPSWVPRLKLRVTPPARLHPKLGV